MPHPLRSASAFAIKYSTSPLQSLGLFRARVRRKHLFLSDDPFESHAAVFTLKSCSPAQQTLSLIPHLHAHLLKSNILAHVHVATALLHAYSASSFDNARQLFDEIPNRNVITSNTMITCYCKNGDLGFAFSVFDGIEHKDIASWSAIIGGFISRGHRAIGFSLFREMMNSGELIPDECLLVTLLGGGSDTGSLRLVGKSIHAYAERNGMQVNKQLGTKLIDMYASCGCLRSAARVFGRISGRNLVHWTTMICGLANHGHGEEAVGCFDEMIRAGVRPNEITFTGLLNACCHAGLVAEGQKYFCSMVEEFGFEPSIHHYGCIVDLFAKAGRLDDAYRIVEDMKVKPNIVVLTSVLAGCKKYKNFEIAEKVIDRVLAMEIPENDGGVYTLVSDLYTMGSKWNDAEKVRKLIDARSVRKNRGASFINQIEERRVNIVA